MSVTGVIWLLDVALKLLPAALSVLHWSQGCFSLISLGPEPGE